LLLYPQQRRTYKASISNTELINTRKLIARYVTFNADLYITAVDGDDIFEYAIEFQTIFDKDIAIRIFRYGFERALNLDYYRDKSHIILKFPEPYLILIEEEPDIHDAVTLEIQVPKSESFHFRINILKYWTYDLGKLYEENKYLLYPLQIFKLRKEMVKSFYDPEVEARGMEKGIQKGIQKGMEKGIEKATKNIAENMIKDGDTDEKIKRCTGLKEEDIYKLRKLLETQGEH
jgi:hypothetical protein